MKAHKTSLVNAILLIVLPLWGYFSSDSPSMTALIPTFIGVALLLLNKGVKNENKIVAHIAVLLTLVVLIGLIKPLTGAIGRSDTAAMIRVFVMILSTIIAMVFFVKSFIDARKKRMESAILSKIKKENPPPSYETKCQMCNKIVYEKVEDIPEGVDGTNGPWQCDHDHSNGTFRGYLCKRCNTGNELIGDKLD